jgi:hypothetical protein
MQIGYFGDFSITIAFYIENESLGSPLKFHSLILMGSPNILLNEK